MRAAGRWFAVAALAFAGACSSSRGGGAPSGEVKITVQPFTSGWDVTRINVEARSPSGAVVAQDLTYEVSTLTFTGVLVVGAGIEDITARAYKADGTQVGQGTALVDVPAGATASVYIKIYDMTGPDPVPDHGPIITSVTADNVLLFVDDVLHLSGTAVDPDGDALTYEWTQACSGNDGTFSAPTGATTTWTTSLEGSCMLTFTATSRALHDAVSLHVLVLGIGAGILNVAGEFVENPEITLVMISTAGPTACNVARYGTTRYPPSGVQTDASCLGTYASSQDVNVEVRLDSYDWDFHGHPVPGNVPTLPDNCGGSSTLISNSDYGATFRWTAPAAGGLCTITPTVAVGPIADAVPISLWVASCPDDPYEPNDTIDYPAWVPDIVTTGLFANDDDWFGGMANSSVLTVSLTTADTLTIEIYDWSGVYAGSNYGVGNAVTVPAFAGQQYKAHVLPGTNAGTCTASYDLTWQ